MAKQTLPTNFQDDILNSSMDGKRRYKETTNSDGSISLEDVSEYDQVGSNFGASQLNLMNDNINQSFDANKMLKTMDEVNAVTQEGYGVDALVVKQLNSSLINENAETFNFGYLNGVRGFFTNPSRADDSFIPFSSGVVFTVSGNTHPSARLANIDVRKKKTIKVNIAYNSGSNLSKQWLDIVGDDNVITSVKTMTYEETLDVSNYSTLLIRGSANGDASANNNSVTCVITV